MIFKRLLLGFTIAASVLSCGKLPINRLSGSTRFFLPSAATLDTPAAVELFSGILRLIATGSGEYGCQFTGSNTGVDGATATASDKILNAITEAQGNLTTTTSYMVITGAKVRIRRVGTPSGNMFTALRTTSGADPSATVLSTSADVLISTASVAPTGGLSTFTFSASREAALGTSFALVLAPQSGATVDGANNFRWVVANGAGCTNFPTYRDSSDSASTWISGVALSPSYFTLVADTHPTSGQTSWIATGHASALWMMSSFDFDENSRVITTGTFTYDVGAGENPTTPTYSNSGLTKAQVQALSNLSGTYFYVRANFAIGGAGFDQAELGNGLINLQ